MLHSLLNFLRFLGGVLGWPLGCVKDCSSLQASLISLNAYSNHSISSLRNFTLYVWSDQAAPFLTTEGCHARRLFCKTTQSVALFCSARSTWPSDHLAELFFQMGWVTASGWIRDSDFCYLCHPI